MIMFDSLLFQEYLAIALPTASCQLSNVGDMLVCPQPAVQLLFDSFAFEKTRQLIHTRVELDLETLEVMDVFCEEDGPVRIHMKSPLDGSARQFDRPRDQQLQKTLQRMALTLKRGPKKKTKTKKAMLRTKEAQQDIQQVSSSERSSQSQSDNIASQVQLVEPDDCLYDNQGQPINDHLPLADAFTSARKPTCLMLGGRRYRIRLNRPLVKTITCGGQPMAGFRLVPVAHWDGEQSIRWEWRTSSGELLARTRCFTPTEADVGSRLEVVARPPLAEDEQMSRLLGVDDDQAAARLSFEAVAKAPPFPPGLAAEREEEMQRQKLSWQLQHDKSNFRVLSYNMLADAYRHCWDYIFPYCDPETLLPERRLQLCRQEVCTFNADIMALQEDQDGEWWPPPLTEQDVATRQRATRLLQAIRQIPLVYYDIKAWENQHENVFSLFRQGCLDAANSNILEAPLYNNRQIEDAWLFLLEMRRRHKNRGKHVQECARVLGASYNWSIVLQGSKKVLEALNDLPQEVCTEILEGADAHELLRSIYPQRRPRRDDWMNTPSSLPANGWSDSDPSWMGKDTPNGAGTRDAWPDAAWPDAGRTKNPFKAEGVATEWPDPPAQVPQTPGQRDVFPGPTGGSFASAHLNWDCCLFRTTGSHSLLWTGMAVALQRRHLALARAACLRTKRRPLSFWTLWSFLSVSDPGVESSKWQPVMRPSDCPPPTWLSALCLGVFRRWKTLGTVAQLALLKSKEPDGRLLLVCNTHLYFANFARHIRVLQVALILDEAESICKRAEFEFGQRPALLFLGDLNSEPDTGATALLQGSVSAAHPDWARCAPFRWGYASSRQAAKDMLTALRTKRPEAYSSLGDETEEDGLDGLRCSTERLQRVRNCLATLGIGEPQEAEEEAPEEQYDQVLGSSTDNSPWTSLEQKLQAGGTFKNCEAWQNRT
eukprot:g2206.t2